MRYLVLWIFLGVAQIAPAATMSPAGTITNVAQIENTHSTPKKGKWFKRLKTFKPFRELDRLAVYAISFSTTPIFAGLLGLLIGGWTAATIMVIFSSPALLVGIIFAVLALARAGKEGWKRKGTAWAIVALAIPLAFLVIFRGLFLQH